MDNLITASKEILRFALRKGSKWAVKTLSDQEYLQEHARLVTDAIEPQLDKISKQIQELHDVELKTAMTDYKQALTVLKSTGPESEAFLPQEVAELLRESFQHAIKAFHAKTNLSVNKRIQAMQLAMTCIALLHDHEPKMVVARWQQLIDELFNDKDILRILPANLEYSPARRYLVRGNKDELKCLVSMATDVFSQLHVLRWECCPDQEISVVTAMKSLVRPPITMSEKGSSSWTTKLTTGTIMVRTIAPLRILGFATVAPTDDGSLILLLVNEEGELLLCKLDQHLNEVHRRVIDACPLSGITVKGSVVYACILNDHAIHMFDHEDHFNEVGEAIPLQSIITEDVYDDHVHERSDYVLTPVATEHGHMVLAALGIENNPLHVYVTALKQPCSEQSILPGEYSFASSFAAFSVSETEVRIGFCARFCDSKLSKIYIMMATKTDNGWRFEPTFSFDDYQLCTFDEKGRFLMMNMIIMNAGLSFLKLDGSEDGGKLLKHKLKDNLEAIFFVKVKRDTVWIGDDHNIERHPFVDLMEEAIEC